MKNLEKENIEGILMGIPYKNGEVSDFQAIDNLITNLRNKENKKRSAYGNKFRMVLHQKHMNHLARTFGEIRSEDLDKLQTYLHPMLKQLSVRSRNLLKGIFRTRKVADKDMLKTIVDPKFFMDISTKYSLDKVREIELLILQMYQILKNKNASKSIETIQLLQYIIPFSMENPEKYLNMNKQLMVFSYLKDTFENTTKLTTTEKNVFINYYMTDENLTLRELGEMIGVSFERIRQMIQKLTEILNDVAVVLTGKADCLPNYFRENRILDEGDFTEDINLAEGVCFNSKLYNIFFKEHNRQSLPVAL